MYCRHDNEGPNPQVMWYDDDLEAMAHIYWPDGFIVTDVINKYARDSTIRSLLRRAPVLVKMQVSTGENGYGWFHAKYAGYANLPDTSPYYSFRTTCGYFDVCVNGYDNIFGVQSEASANRSFNFRINGYTFELPAFSRGMVMWHRESMELYKTAQTCKFVELGHVFDADHVFKAEKD